MSQKWYYRIELGEGEFTDGRPIGTFSTLKKVIRGFDLAGKTVLDIGTQELAMPLVMSSRGAAQVVAYDREDLSERLAVLGEHYDLSRINYVAGTPFHQLRERLARDALPTRYDVVNFTGVLYHMLDPLAGLVIARSFLREGGLMLLETSAVVAPGYFAACNRGGQLYPGSNFFQVSVGALDYWCRMLRMELLDLYWLGGNEVDLFGNGEAEAGKISRVFMVLRAVDKPIAADDDQWMQRGFIPLLGADYGLDFGQLKSAEPAVAYTPPAGQKAPLMTRAGTPYVDALATLRARPTERPRLNTEEGLLAGSLSRADLGVHCGA